MNVNDEIKIIQNLFIKAKFCPVCGKELLNNSNYKSCSEYHHLYLFNDTNVINSYINFDRRVIMNKKMLSFMFSYTQNIGSVLVLREVDGGKVLYSNISNLDIFSNIRYFDLLFNYSDENFIKTINNLLLLR